MNGTTANPRLTLTADANTAPATAKFDALFNRITDGLKLGLGLDIGQRITQAVAEIPARLKGAVDMGIAFNSQLESANISIAAMLHQFDRSKWGNMEAGLKTSADLIKALRHEARTTVATFEDLVGASQVFMGPALSAGVRAEQVPALASMLSRAVSTLMGPQFANPYQLAQEGRALLTGDIGPQAMVARQLGITRADIQTARQSGRLMEFLTEKLGAFNQAAAFSAQSLGGLKSNLQDALNDVFGDAMEPAFNRLKKLTADLIEKVGSPEFEKGARAMGKAAEVVIAAGDVVIANLLPLLGITGLVAAPQIGRLVGKGGRWLMSPWKRFSAWMRGAGTAGLSEYEAFSGMTAASRAGLSTASAFTVPSMGGIAGPMIAGAVGAGGNGIIPVKGIAGRAGSYLTRLGGNLGFWIGIMQSHERDLSALEAAVSKELSKRVLKPAPSAGSSGLQISDAAKWVRQQKGIDVMASREGLAALGIDSKKDSYLDQRANLRVAVDEGLILKRLLANLQTRTFGDQGYFYTAGGASAQREQSRRGQQMLLRLQEIVQLLRRGLKVDVQDLPT